MHIEEKEKLKQEFSKDFANVIKRLRQDKNFTQKEMAVFLGIPLSTIINWENGKGHPLLSHLFLLCKKFKSNPSDILGF